MNSKAFLLASALFALGTGLASAGNVPLPKGVPPVDFSPQHFNLHANEMTRSEISANRTTSGIARQAPTTVQKMPTHLLPRELQWMDRGQDMLSGSGR